MYQKIDQYRKNQQLVIDFFKKLREDSYDVIFRNVSKGYRDKYGNAIKDLEKSNDAFRMEDNFKKQRALFDNLENKRDSFSTLYEKVWKMLNERIPGIECRSISVIATIESMAEELIKAKWSTEIAKKNQKSFLYMREQLEGFAALVPVLKAIDLGTWSKVDYFLENYKKYTGSVQYALEIIAS